MKYPQSFRTWACLAVLLSLVSGGASWAQQRPQNFEQRIRKHFGAMLRSELALSDEQSDRVLPLVTELETFKRKIGSSRRETVRSLRQGMQEGSSDAELRDLLATLDRLEDEQRNAEREMMERIDAELTTRQSVKLRFFVQSFRREVSDRLRGGTERSRRPRNGAGPRHPRR